MYKVVFGAFFVLGFFICAKIIYNEIRNFFAHKKLIEEHQETAILDVKEQIAEEKSIRTIRQIPVPEEPTKPRRRAATRKRAIVEDDEDFL